MTLVRARFGWFEVTVPIDPRPPLGWRFWALAGFPGDPVEPRPYGGSQCLPLAIVDLDGTARWLCAMELDHSLRLFCSHDLFPCAEQAGVEAFARTVLDHHAQQPTLL